MTADERRRKKDMTITNLRAARKLLGQVLMDERKDPVLSGELRAVMDAAQKVDSALVSLEREATEALFEGMED